MNGNPRLFTFEIGFTLLHESGEAFNYLRFSIATSTEELKKGVERIAAGAADREGFRRFFAAEDFVSR
jgi:acyl transferase domain-containing protein